MNGNACNAGYNPKIDKIFRSPSPPKSRTENLHILALEGLILYFRGKGELLAVPVYSVCDCDLGQNRWKTFDNPPPPLPPHHHLLPPPNQGWDVLAFPWFWSDGGPVPSHRQHTHTGQYRVQPVLKMNYTRGLYRVSCGLYLQFLKKHLTLIELKRQLISGAKGVDRSFFHVITQQSFNAVVNCIVHY